MASLHCSISYLNAYISQKMLPDEYVAKDASYIYVYDTYVVTHFNTYPEISRKFVPKCTFK